MEKTRLKFTTIIVVLGIGAYLSTDNIYAKSDVTTLPDEIVESNDVETGWVQKGDEWYYYENGVPKEGLLSYKGSLYYLDKDGKMYHGELINTYLGEIYYANDDGKLAVDCWMKNLEDWQVDGNYWYRFDSNGKAVSGWYSEGGFDYYFSNGGYCYSATVTAVPGSNDLYHFDENGHLLRGWNRRQYDGYEGSLVYSDPVTGVVAIGWQEIDGFNYYFNEYSGEANCNGVYTIEDNMYYFDENCHLLQDGWIKSDDTEWASVYYARSDGSLLTGWQEIDGHMYYFDTYSAYMYRGFNEIDEKKYNFDYEGHLLYGWNKNDEYSGWTYSDPSTGEAYIGWKKFDEIWYYFSEYDGETYHNGVYSIGDQLYFFDKNGHMLQNGWGQSEDSEWANKYYAQSNGALVTGWYEMDGNRYYFDLNEGYMYRYINEIDGIYYNFNKDGHLLYGWNKNDEYSGWSYSDPESGEAYLKWKEIDGFWYYFDEYSGEAYYDGSFTIEDQLYYFDDKGHMLKNGWIRPYDGGNVYYARSDGTLFTGWHDIDGNRYYFDQDYGFMYTGIHKIDGINYNWN